MLDKSNLNFRIYTAETTPATGVENDICVISTTPMNNWILSPDEPEGMPRNNGDVWLQYSVKGNTANILKTEVLNIDPVSAYQYIDGEWVEVNAMSYWGGNWVRWYHGELFKGGEQYIDVTGGWSKYRYMYYRAEYVHATPTIGETITVDASRTIGTNMTTSIAGTQKEIDVTDKNILSLDVLSVTGTCFVSILNNSTMNTHPTYAHKTTYLTTAGHVEIDISSITGLMYIAVVAVYSYESTKNICVVDNIKLT